MKETGLIFNTEMTLLKDMGMQYKKIGDKQKVRLGLYSCPICREPFITRMSTVKNGSSTKCRKCQVILKNTKHNRSKTRLYNIWARMKYRCYNPKNPAFRWYGNEGVTVCKEWVDNFPEFEKWAISNGYKENLVLDKDFLCHKYNIYPKIYSPRTCKWVTVSENSKERNRMVYEV